MSEEEKPKSGWGGKREGSGRPKGRVDPRPREIREAMLLGAATSDLGRDAEHPDGGLVVFFSNMKRAKRIGMLDVRRVFDRRTRQAGFHPPSLHSPAPVDVLVIDHFTDLAVIIRRRKKNVMTKTDKSERQFSTLVQSLPVFKFKGKQFLSRPLETALQQAQEAIDASTFDHADYLIRVATAT